ncbi:MAG: putative Na+/H+ antiporter [Limnohabitans sp.]|nr:putative Na+/H+ antiporter [Limnohabitans sp.]
MLTHPEAALPWLAALIFALALVHSFSTRFFEKLAHAQPRHAGLWHLLGEVEVVFGLWATLLMLVSFALLGQDRTLAYLESRNFTEPLFVFAIMVIAGTQPILVTARAVVLRLTACWPGASLATMVFVVLSLVPLLGSFITEPAAMTLAALLLRDALFAQPCAPRVKYAVLGVLFVNISIGGTLTPFAAPPVLMVAGPWHWDFAFMLSTFGWKAAIAVLVNAAGVTWWLRADLNKLPKAVHSHATRMPLTIVMVHLLFLVGVVYFAHHPVVFLGLSLLFLGFATAYRQHQTPLILREALLVAFFLAGLVVLGGLQQWWLEPLLLAMSPDSVFFGAVLLTAITDNAALTYLGSLVPGLSDAFKVALVAGAVSGGGLTLIANAPNPAAAALLKAHFPDHTIAPGQLLLAASMPTLVAMAAFWLL